MDQQAKATLDRRLAAGEISMDEYERILNILNEDGSEQDFQRYASAQLNSKNDLLLDVGDGFELFRHYIIYKNRKFLHSEITSLGYGRFYFSMNGIKMSDSSSLSIELQDGYQIKLSEETGMLRFRGNKGKLLEKAYQILQPATFQMRLNRLAGLLAVNRYIKIQSSPLTKLYPDGLIESENGTKINIKISRLNKGLFLGTSFNSLGGDYSSSPDEINIIEQPKLFRKKQIKFTLSTNQDAWKALLIWLSEEGNVL
jgi:hypothetical protein